MTHVNLTGAQAFSEIAGATVGFENTPCLVCGATEYTPRFQLHDWACELPGNFQLVTCRQCGHVYQTPRPNQNSIGHFYPQSYEPFWRAAPERGWRAWRQRWGWRPRCQQVAHLRPGGHLLDIGSSTGVFLHEMRGYGGWQVAGVETNPFAAAYARQHFGLDVFIGQVEAAPWPTGSFDVVTMWDVLEHLPEPRAALERIRALLGPDGFLICSVPNADSLDARLFGRYWIGLDAPRHMSVFHRKSLLELLKRADFEVEATFCFYGRYATFALSVQQWLRARSPKGRLRQVVEPLLFLPIWRYLTLPYFWLVDQLGLGAILTLRCRPKAHR